MHFYFQIRFDILIGLEDDHLPIYMSQNTLVPKQMLKVLEFLQPILQTTQNANSVIYYCYFKIVLHNLPFFKNDVL